LDSFPLNSLIDMSMVMLRDESWVQNDGSNPPDHERKLQLIDLVEKPNLYRVPY